MAQTTSSVGANLLKRVIKGGPEKLLFGNKGGFFAAVNKSTNGGGEYHQLNWIIDGLTTSSGFDAAKNNAGTQTYPRALVDYVDIFCFGSVDNKAIMRSKGDAHAVESLLKAPIEGAHYSIGRKLRRDLWGDRSGMLGRVSTSTAPSTTTITLNDYRDCVKFEVGMWIVGSDVATGASLHASPNRARITAINADPTTPTLTVHESVATSMPGLGTSDYLYEEGSVGSAVCDGILRWIPITAPTAGDSQWGVDRSVNVTRMAGSRFTSASGPIEERLLDGLAFLDMMGGEADTYWLHPMRAAELRKNVQALSQYGYEPFERKAKNLDGSEAPIGVRGFRIVGPTGPVEILEDRYCNVDYAVGTEMDSWLLESMDDLPHWDMQGGDKLFVENNSDGKQFRLKGYFQLMNKRPKNSVLVPLT